MHCPGKTKNQLSSCGHYQSGQHTPLSPFSLYKLFRLVISVFQERPLLVSSIVDSRLLDRKSVFAIQIPVNERRIIIFRGAKSKWSDDGGHIGGSGQTANLMQCCKVSSPTEDQVPSLSFANPLARLACFNCCLLGYDQNRQEIEPILTRNFNWFFSMQKQNV